MTADKAASPVPVEHSQEFDLLATLLESVGRVCHPITTAGGGEMCNVHKFQWPCRRQWEVTRQELVAAIRQLGIEHAYYAAGQDNTDSPVPS